MNKSTKLTILILSAYIITIMVILGFVKYSNSKFIKSKFAIRTELKLDTLTRENLFLKSENALLKDQLKAINNNFDSDEQKDSTMSKIYELERKILSRSNTFSELRVVVDNIHLNSPNFTEFPTIIPLRPGTYKRVSSMFGVRNHPILKVEKFHQGLDISAPYGTLVYAPAHGYVKEVNPNAKGYGMKILIEHKFGFKTIFGHLSEPLIKVGQEVNVGDVIAKVGSTGLSTGPHLHYEILKNGFKIDPIEFTRITEKKLSNN